MNLDSVLKHVLAQILSVEDELENLHERVKEIKDEIHEASMGETI